MDEVIRVSGLMKSYAGRTVVREVSLTVGRGEVFGLLGANGAGKTTSVECMVGVRVPDAAIYVLYAAVSLALLYVVATLCFGVQMRGSWLVFLGGWLLTLVSMLSIGLLVGGIARTSKQASVIASVLYFPMLVFSGATLPFEIMPPVVQQVANVMPLTQGIKLMKSAFLGLPVDASLVPLVVLAVVAVVCCAAAIRFFRWE